MSKRYVAFWRLVAVQKFSLTGSYWPVPVIRRQLIERQLNPQSGHQELPHKIGRGLLAGSYLFLSKHLRRGFNLRDSRHLAAFELGLAFFIKRHDTITTVTDSVTEAE